MSSCLMLKKQTTFLSPLSRWEWSGVEWSLVTVNTAVYALSPPHGRLLRTSAYPSLSMAVACQPECVTQPGSA